MPFSVTAFAKKIPLPFIYAASGWLITEIPVVLTILPPTLDGYSTAGIAAGLGFVLSAAVWTHNELKGFISSPSQSGSSGSGGSAPQQPPALVIPSQYGTAAGSPVLATAANTQHAPNESNYDVPLGSWVQATSTGWYVIFDATGAMLAATKINPLD